MRTLYFILYTLYNVACAQVERADMCVQPVWQLANIMRQLNEEKELGESPGLCCAVRAAEAQKTYRTSVIAEKMQVPELLVVLMVRSELWVALVACVGGSSTSTVVVVVVVRSSSRSSRYRFIAHFSAHNIPPPHFPRSIFALARRSARPRSRPRWGRYPRWQRLRA